MQKEDSIYHFILIEDNDIDLFFHEKMILLQNLSSDIKPFPHAVKAFEYIASFKNKVQDYPNTIILLDIQMPGMNAFGFLKHFETLPERLISKNCIFIVSSSLDYADLKRLQAHHLVNKIFTKPLDADQLKQAIKEYAIY